MKCKSPSHVDVVASASAGDRPGIWSVLYVEHGACRNVSGYSDELYVLTRNGKPGMQMLPDLAAVMPARLRDAARVGPSARIRHRVAKIPWPYATLTTSAALELATQIEAALR